MNDQGEEDKWANKSHKDRVSLIEPHMESGAKAPEFVPNKPSSFVTQARIRERKFNFETIAEQRAELEEFRYKLDMFESRLRNSSFMDPEQRGILHELAKEAREHLKKLEPKVNHIHRSSQKSLVIIFTIFTLFVTLYIFLIMKTIWKDDKIGERIEYD